jgi:hypothetical protein
MSKHLVEDSPKPQFLNWLEKQKHLLGLHLLYSDQCPWHEKSVSDLKDEVKKQGILLNIVKLIKAIEAKNTPSGFGTFSLIEDGQLIADHYISRTRFLNILKSM